MTTQGVRTPVEYRATNELSERFAQVFRTNDAGEDLFAADVFFDLNMPVWRFQMQGVDAFEAWLKTLSNDGIRIRVVRTIPTPSGFVTEHEGAQEKDGKTVTFRHIWLCEVRDDRIAEVIGYCSGEWDEALRARHAAEAPMIRP